QVQLILDQFPDGTVGVDPPNWRDEPGSVRYLYRTASVLVRDRDLERFRELLGRRGAPFDGGINGLTRYELPTDFDYPDEDPPRPDLPPTLRLLAYVDRKLGVGVCTPDHLVYVCPVSPCPASEPEEVPAGAEPDPGRSSDRC